MCKVALWLSRTEREIEKMNWYLCIYVAFAAATFLVLLAITWRNRPKPEVRPPPKNELEVAISLLDDQDPPPPPMRWIDLKHALLISLVAIAWPLVPLLLITVLGVTIWDRINERL